MKKQPSISKTIIPVGYRQWNKNDGSARAARQFNNWMAYIHSQVRSANMPKLVIGTIPAKPETAIEQMECLLDEAREILTFTKTR